MVRLNVVEKVSRGELLTPKVEAPWLNLIGGSPSCNHQLKVQRVSDLLRGSCDLRPCKNITEETSCMHGPCGSTEYLRG